MSSNNQISPSVVMGEMHCDDRGVIRYFNSFRFNNIVRMYQIEPKDMHTIRAWQGHKIEKKYFFPASGKFLVNLISPDDWINPARDCKITSFQINSEKNQILEIPPGHINGFRALENNSKLIVFSSSTLRESASDDYRWSLEYFSEAKWFD